MPKAPSQTELMAASMIARDLGALSCEPYDDGTKPMMYDFTLRLPNDRTAAVEVTSDPDAGFLRFWNAAKKYPIPPTGGRFGFEATSMSTEWNASPRDA